MISSTISELVEMLILMVGEMFTIFPSLKASGVGPGVLEPVDLPMDEIFGLHRKLVRLRHKFFREEEQAMVHVVPWVFQGGQSLSPHHCGSNEETGLMDRHWRWR